ncbi:hypothetical protein DPX16_22340 [Anabarilius grahami]|uniref:Uncharacterized protein n=1 Tax=Anabarilius grahami TaxID=495550 RepID=A0A3N0YSG7_ANAGA|nr:hypothetical protein DPX16_22340 [Anabarilius grahami]
MHEHGSVHRSGAWSSSIPASPNTISSGDCLCRSHGQTSDIHRDSHMARPGSIKARLRKQSECIVFSGLLYRPTAVYSLLRIPSNPTMSEKEDPRRAEYTPLDMRVHSTQAEFCSPECPSLRTSWGAPAFLQSLLPAPFSGGCVLEILCSDRDGFTPGKSYDKTRSASLVALRVTLSPLVAGRGPFLWLPALIP